MRRLLYVDFIIFFLFLLFIPIKAQSARLISYGFEDWTGDADTTPGYCFGTNYSDYWALHEESTEVISSYGSWTPSSGSYFFYREHHSGTSGGVLGGSNSGAINDHGNLGKCDYSHPDSSCSSGYGHTFNMETEFPRNRPGNDIFIRFKIRFNSGYYQTALNTKRTKFIRLYRDSVGLYSNDSCYLMFANKPYSQAYWLFATSCSNPSKNTVSSSVSFSSIGINVFDGEWHTISYWAKLQDTIGSGNGQMKAWFDKWGEETSGNADMSWDSAPMGSSTTQHFDHVCFCQNFGGGIPTSSCAVGIDDIEIWDGMPTGINPPKNLRKVPTP